MKYRFQGGIDSFATHSVLKDFSVRPEEEKMGNAVHSIFLGKCSGSRIQQLRIMDAQLFHCLFCCILFILYRNSQDDKAFVFIVVVGFDDKRRLIPAGTAPGSPEIHQDIGPLPDKVRQIPLGFDEIIPGGIQLDNCSFGGRKRLVAAGNLSVGVDALSTLFV